MRGERGESRGERMEGGGYDNCYTSCMVMW